MSLVRFGNHADHAGYEIRNVLAEKVNGLPTPNAGMNGRYVYNTTNNRFYVCENGVWGLTATNADALGGQTLAQVRDFSATTGQRPASAISDFDTQVRTSRLDQLAAPTGSLSVGGQKIINLLAGTASTDAVTKAQLDAVAAIANAGAVGIAIKAPVKAASTTNISLSGAQTIDGVSIVAGDRVLVAGQTAGAANGIYVAATGAWTRATDADQDGEIVQGTLVAVYAGTANGDSLWGLTSDVSVVIGSTVTTWAKIISGGAGFSIAGAGLTGTGSTVAVNVGSGLVADPTLRVDNTIYNRKYKETLSAGAATRSITHNLNNADVEAKFFDIATGDRVLVGYTSTGVNTISAEFGAALTTNQFRVEVTG